MGFLLRPGPERLRPDLPILSLRDTRSHLADEIASGAVAGCELEVQGNPDADQRTYKADFSKFARAFPDFEFKWTAETGAVELAQAFERLGFGAEQFTGDRFVRLRWLNRLLQTGELDDALRWADAKELRG